MFSNILFGTFAVTNQKLKNYIIHKWYDIENNDRDSERRVVKLSEGKLCIGRTRT